MKDDKLEKGKQSMNAYAKYSSLTIQVILIVVLAGWGGRELDKWLEMSFPLFTVVLVVIGAVAGFYYLFRELLKK